MHTQIRLFVWSGFSLFDILTTILYFPALITNILFENKKRNVFLKLEVACQKGIDKQCRPRSDCFWKSSVIRVFPVCYSTSILCISALITNILFENSKRNVFLKLEVACQNGLDKQCRPRSDCFWRSSLIRVFPLCYSTSILCISTLITNILFENSKRNVFFKLEVAYQKGLDKQWGPRSDFFWRISLIRVFPVCYSTSILCNPALITNILFENSKRFFFKFDVACQKGQGIQCRPRSDCFWRSLIRVFPVCYSTSILCILALITNFSFWEQ